MARRPVTERLGFRAPEGSPRQAAETPLAVVDSHFHLDRLEDKVGRQGLSCIRAHNGRPPRVPFDVQGGVLKYCDPPRYSRILFPTGRQWGVAVGIHPKALHGEGVCRVLASASLPPGARGIGGGARLLLAQRTLGLSNAPPGEYP